MKRLLTLTLFAFLAGVAGADAAISQGQDTDRSLMVLPAAIASGKGLELRLARNGADDPVNHDANEHLFDNLLGDRHHRQGKGRGADDGSNHGSNDNSGNGSSGNDSHGSGSSGSDNSGSGKGGSGG